MQSFCSNCLQPINEGDTHCPQCCDDNLSLLTYEEMTPEQKKSVLKSVKVNKANILKFVLAFLGISVAVLAVLFILRLWLNSILLPYLYMIPYILFLVFFEGQLIDYTAMTGQLHKAKIYYVGTKWCESLGGSLLVLLFLFDLFTDQI